MLRLNVYCSSCCSLIRNSRDVRTSFRFQLRQNRRLNPRVLAKALKDDQTDGGGGRFSGQKWDPGLEIEVPFEQRPVNEYSSLKDSALYSWGELGAGPFFLRLGGLWLVSFTVLGVPIAAASFNPSREPLRFVLAAGIGTLLLVSLIVLRIYLASFFIINYYSSGLGEGI